VSKEFTASLILLLAQDGKLTLDEPVGHFLPELTDAQHITIRQILSHTSGYRDFWPEDYSPIAFRTPTTPQALVDRWATLKLDFPPGTAWQYSNTGYAIAALIAEKAGGAPFFTQLRQRIFTKLKMTSVRDYNADGVPKGLVGYERYGFGPPRPAPLDRQGWSFGSGSLAMTAHDLALWDISLMNRSLLAPASYDALESDTKLANGTSTGYGLGVQLSVQSGHLLIRHSGEETGFVSENMVFPNDHDAVCVLTNQDASRAAAIIAKRVAAIAFRIPPIDEKDPHLARVLAILSGLAKGHIEPAQFNANAQSYFTPQAISDYARSLAPLGPPLAARERAHEDRGGMVERSYDVTYAARTVSVSTYELADHRLGQFLIVP
jgi:CubicO group peptidase (beta-lactamase class C family)